jgi:hypothetical protein
MLKHLFKAQHNPIETSIGTSFPLPLLRLLHSPEAQGAAFQSVLVTTIQIVRGVKKREAAARGASLSMAQGEKLCAMIEELDAMLQAMQSVLNERGTRLLALAPDAEPESRPCVSWWFCLADGIETLNSSIDRIGSIVSGQPKGSPARKLSSSIMRLLRGHYNSFLADAGEWLN